jgi:diguanylate cyclase (GGDEF)-like protein
MSEVETGEIRTEDDITLDQVSVMSLAVTTGPVRSAFDTAVQLLEAGRASLLLRNGAEPTLIVAASTGIDPRLAASIRVPVGQGIAGVVYERGIPLFGTLDGQTFLSVPVSTERGVEGVLNVTDRLAGKQYSIDHIGLATTAALHIGHLIQYDRTAARDPVSGLHNRRSFEEMLKRELTLSERTGNPFTVVFMDLDNLKAINDQYGHAKGDEVIRAVGDALQHVIRPYDYAGRYGGDEFALLLTGVSDPNDGIASRIEEALRQVSQTLQVTVSTSTGLARWPADGRTGGQIVETADRRMYQQKRAKKDGARRTP